MNHRKTLQQIVPRIWTTKSYSPGWKMMDSQEFWYIRRTGSILNLKVHSLAGKSSAHTIKVSQTMSKSTWKQLQNMLLGANFVDFACFFFNQPLLPQSSPLQNTAKTEPCTGSGKALVDWKCLRCLRHVWRGKDKPSVGFGWLGNWDTFLGIHSRKLTAGYPKWWFGKGNHPFKNGTFFFFGLYVRFLGFLDKIPDPKHRQFYSEVG